MNRYRLRYSLGMWWLRLPGEVQPFALLTWDQAVAAIHKAEAKRLAGDDFTIVPTADGRGALRLAVTRTTSTHSTFLQTWEQVALFLLGVRTREAAQALRRLERAYGLTLSPLP